MAPGILLTGDEVVVMENVDWRTNLQPASRQRIVNKILDTLKKHSPSRGEEGHQELKRIAERFEEKVYVEATSQQCYLRKLALKMLALEMRSEKPMEISQPTAASTGKNP